jgi:hypothetical protein
MVIWGLLLLILSPQYARRRMRTARICEMVEQ